MTLCDDNNIYLVVLDVTLRGAVMARVHQGGVTVGEGAQMVFRYGLGGSIQRTGEQ